MTHRKKPLPRSTSDIEVMKEMIAQSYEELKSLEPESEGHLEPPWSVIPGYPMTSMAWRMGGGEDYRLRFGLFFRSLSHDERIAYQRQHPEPEGWEGFYLLCIERS